ncbi:cell division ATP-dependent zinc protease FtsH [Desulfuromonas sp. DDH964]|uniref:AAA family ATPase n=1 Tax=Desulfuromonas sp. DDH964 TaxID=1823759 RepID=UPI00078B5ECA|nr:ATP-binding protein [Desulfuromonas sp. DDH964]AMV72210.1 cell division ATP-dependent zinc protease FtsH [Desulfuromonas sp. DDH964]
MDECKTLKKELVQVARMAVSEKPDDVRLYVARMVRKYRSADPDFSEQLEKFLRNNSPRSNPPLRKNDFSQMAIPADEETRLLLLKPFHDQGEFPEPFFSPETKNILEQLVMERKQAKKLKSHDLSPAKSAIFIGKPGVGKTLSARWLASQLGVPLFILDLTAVMSSFLGRTGANLRAAVDFAKQRPCVLLLDEIDAIAKRRNDDADIGELKRLVTVMLQEVENWPDSGMLLAATNHPELLDPALWRRFDLLVKFDLPDKSQIQSAICRYLGKNFSVFEKWQEVLAYAFNGESYSDIERTLQRFRRAMTLNISDDKTLVEELLTTKSITLDRQDKKNLAMILSENGNFSQHTISKITGVSRDTIRKHSGGK